MNKLLVALGLALLIASVCLVTTGSAFEENFQYYDDAGEFDAKWTKGGTDCGGQCDWNGKGYVSELVSNYPAGYTYSKAYHMQACGAAFCNGAGWIKSTKFSSETNYVSFNLLSESEYNTAFIKIRLFNDADVEIASFSTYTHTHTAGFWEFVRFPDTNNLYFYVDGVNAVSGGGAVDTCAEEFSYVEISVNAPCAFSVCLKYIDIWFDDISTTGYIDGLGSYQYTHKLTEDDPVEIDYSWTMKHYPDSLFDSYVYKVQIRDSSGGLISSETLIGSDRDHGIREYSRSTLFGLNYDRYWFSIQRDGIEYGWEYLDFLHPLSDGHSIVFDEDIYYIGENANISYVLNTPDYGAYDYYVRVYYTGVDPKELKESWEITSGSTGYVNFNTTNMTEGYYLAKLAIIDGEDESPLAYDYTALASIIRISGYTYNVRTGVVIGDVHVNFSQDSTWFNGTSNTTTGYYELEGFEAGEEIGVSASKTSYEHYNWSFTPLSTGFYDIDLYLFPTDMAPYPRVVGQVVTYPYYQPMEGATVNIFNGTWNATNTTTMMGWYEFDADDGITGTFEYTMNATMTGYFTTEDTNVTVEAAILTEQHFLLEPSLTLTLKAKESTTGGYISIFNVTLDGNIYATVNGILVIEELGFKYYVILVQSPGYYVYSLPYLLEEDSEIEVELILVPITGVPGVGTYLSPHDVSFTVQDILSRKKEDVTVTLSFEDTTMVDWDTLVSTYGYNEETFSENVSMSGITDSQGMIVFLMIPAARYKIEFKNIALGIDETWYIYPKKDDYTIYVSTGLFGGITSWLAGQPSITGDEVIVTFSVDQVSEAKCYLNIVYNDTTLNTNNIFLYVNSSDGTVLNSKYKDLNYYEYSYLVSNISGNTFIYGIIIDHNEYGILKEAKVVHFVKRILVMDGWTESYYNWASFAFIFTFGALFTGITVKYGAVIVPIFSWLFWYIGWLNIANVLIILGIITTFGIIYYITDKGRKEHMT